MMLNEARSVTLQAEGHAEQGSSRTVNNYGDVHTRTHPPAAVSPDARSTITPSAASASGRGLRRFETCHPTHLFALVSGCSDKTSPAARLNRPLGGLARPSRRPITDCYSPPHRRASNVRVRLRCLATTHPGAPCGDLDR